jgi:hypothetical protein
LAAAACGWCSSDTSEAACPACGRSGRRASSRPPVTLGHLLPTYGLTVSGLVKKGWSGLTDDDEVECAANTLAGLGWLRFRSVRRAGKGGHTAIKIELGPNIATEGKIIYPAAAGAGADDKTLKT